MVINMVARGEFAIERNISLSPNICPSPHITPISLKLVKTRVFISSNAINEVNLSYFAMKWQNFGITASFFALLPIFVFSL